MKIHHVIAGVTVLWLGFFTVKTSLLLFDLANIPDTPNKCLHHNWLFNVFMRLFFACQMLAGQKGIGRVTDALPELSAWKSEALSRQDQTHHSTTNVKSSPNRKAPKDPKSIAEGVTCKAICSMSLYTSAHSGAILLLSRADVNHQNSGFLDHVSIGT